LLASVGKLLLDWKKIVRQIVSYILFFILELQHSTIIQILVLLYVYIVALTSERAYKVVYKQGIFSIPFRQRQRYSKKNRQVSTISTVWSRVANIVTSYGESALCYLDLKLGRNRRRRCTGRCARPKYMKATKKRGNVRRIADRLSVRSTYNIPRRSAQKLCGLRNRDYSRHYLPVIQRRDDPKKERKAKVIKQKDDSKQNKSTKVTSEKVHRTKFVLSTEQETKRKQLLFDTDSFEIKLDTGCSYTISGTETDFIPGTIVPTKDVTVGAYGGTTVRVTGIGTVQWTILDDDGKPLVLKIPNSLFVKGTPTRLLSPQHYAQVATVPGSTAKMIFSTVIQQDRIEMIWSSPRAKKTINLDSSNIGTLFSAPGYDKASTFFAQIQQSNSDYPVDQCCYQCEFHVDALNAAKNEGDPTYVDEEHDIHQISDKGTLFEKAESIQDTPILMDITDNMFKNSAVNLEALDETYIDDSKPEDLLLLMHYRFGHIPMKRLQRLAEKGVIPSKLARCSIPICQSCIYGKMTRRPWKTKKDSDRPTPKTASAPGEIISVDQLESPVAGFIAQLKGKLSKRRFRAATIFVDHYSSLSFVHLQQSITGKETLQAKWAFESFAEACGVKIQHYHADNGRFAEALWKEDVSRQRQNLTFSGVGAHHQNGRAEKRIRDLQDMARTSLIHANRHWPDAINTHLWPYALRHANECVNLTPFPEQTETPLERFTKTKVLPNYKDIHPFGCPAYALDGHVQSGMKAPKWGIRARLAIYIGPSPTHARSVSNLLSLTTGLVSPQYHVRYDDTFQTVRQNPPIRSLWQQLSGLTRTTFTKSRATQETQIPVGTNDTVMRVDHVNDGLGINEQQQDDQVTVTHDHENHIENEGDVNDIDTPNDSDDDEIIITHPAHPRMTRSGRMSVFPQRYDEYIALLVENKEIEEVQQSMALAARSDPDILYLNEALAADDRAEFVRAMDKEVQAHVENKNWEIVLRSDIPKDKKVLPAVWAMRRKRDIATRQVTKWKARLNLHGGKQTKGIDYWETYAPVASWSSIRLIMYLAAWNRWQIRQLDFVLAFPQAPVETDLYMEIPSGFDIGDSKKDYALKLVNNLYGQKQAGRVWNTHLTQGLKALGFTQATTDPCIFWRDDVILVIYTDDTIVTGPDAGRLDKAIKDIADSFNITSQIKVDDFLGVKIGRNEKDQEITFTQPHLIDSILRDLNLLDESNARKLPASTQTILHKYEESEPHNDDEFHYRSVIGKLSYLEKCTRPDLAYAVHQCARFSAAPKVEHTKAVKLIGRYLLGTRTKGIVCRPTDEALGCYADAGFAGEWNPDTAEDDPVTARSRTGFIIMYAGCPLIWSSKLQTEIALSTTESEYISLSASLREVIPLQRLIEELRSAGIQLPSKQSKVYCKVFEDNSGAFEMARSPKMRPRTKHLNIKYHHFREEVDAGRISIHQVDTKEQIADIFTKPLGHELFCKFRLRIMGWDNSDEFSRKPKLKRRNKINEDQRECDENMSRTLNSEQQVLEYVQSTSSSADTSQVSDKHVQGTSSVSDKHVQGTSDKFERVQVTSSSADTSHVSDKHSG
jgi:Reverse transcriptase (RNA-dependent DNA polymerase)/GAG-pre-integrase domain